MIKFSDIQKKWPDYNEAEKGEIKQKLQEELSQTRKKIIVLDDDPTGTQTVHDIPVYTDWSAESMKSGVNVQERMFFVLTNSRAFSEEKTTEVHKEIAGNILSAVNDFILISRGDSTLRGHYPLETQVLYDSLTAGGLHLNGEIIFPFFPEGGRFTLEKIHYVRYGDDLIPAGETEFAKDKTFGYQASSLTEWVQEKTSGKYPAESVLHIGLSELRARDYDSITQKLCAVQNFGKITVDSLTYEDVQVFAIAYYRALRKGKNFLIRSAAALVRILGGVTAKPVLEKEDLQAADNPNGGVVIIGSHVKMTTAQLAELRKKEDMVFIEMNQHLAVDEIAFEQEVQRVIRETNDCIGKGKSVACFTRRERFDIDTGDKEDELRLAGKISEKLTSVVAKLEHKPSFIIAKGGITSSDVATIGLGIKKAMVMGQILPGVPVWFTGSESKFPGMPYVIFPGNVGSETALLDAVNKFME